MIELQNINGYGLEDPGFELLKQVAQKYCPEEFQEERKAVLPDESLNLEALSVLYDTVQQHPTEPVPIQRILRKSLLRAEHGIRSVTLIRRNRSVHSRSAPR